MPTDPAQTNELDAAFQADAQQWRAAQASPIEVTPEARVSAAQAYPPQVAAQAIQNAPSAGVRPDLAIAIPDAVAAAAKANQNQSILSQAPDVAKWVQSTSMAHVAAAQDNLGDLAQINDVIQDFLTKPWRDIAAQYQETNESEQRLMYEPPTSLADAISRPFQHIGNIYHTIGIATEAMTHALGVGYLGDEETNLLNQAAPHVPEFKLPVFGLGDVVGQLVNPVGYAGARGDSLGRGGTEGLGTWLNKAVGFASLFGGSPEGTLESADARIDLQDRAEAARAEAQAQYNETGDVASPQGRPQAVTPTNPLMGTDGTPLEFPSARAAGVYGLANRPEGTIPVPYPTGKGTFGIDLQPTIGEPPLGTNPTADAGRGYVAQADAQAVKNIEDSIAESPISRASPETMRDFLETRPGIEGATATIPAQSFLDLANTHPDVVTQLTKLNPGALGALTSAHFAGGNFAIPMADYLSLTEGKPWADALRDITRFSVDGVSVAESKDLWKPEEPLLEPEHVFTPPALERDPDFSDSEHAALTAQQPAITQAASQAASQIYLKGVFADAKSLGMSEMDLKLWSGKVQDAQRAVYDRLIERAKTQIREFRKPEWKVTYNKHYGSVANEYQSRPAVIARNQLTSPATLTSDLVTGNALVANGKPITFYRATNFHDTGDGEVPIDLFENPRPPQIPHPYWTSTVKLSHYRGASFSQDPHFASGWGPGEGQNEIKDSAGNIIQHEKRRVIWITHVKTNAVGDFRSKADVAKALEWYKKTNPQEKWEDDQEFKDRVRERERLLERGDWPSWESPEMMRNLGWDAVRMVEHPGQTPPNLFVIKPDAIYWKYDAGSVPTKIRLDSADRAFVPKDLLARLPKGIWAKDGEPLESFADKLGFENGSAMLNELASLEDMRGKTNFNEWLERQIKAEAAERAKDELGWDLSPAGLLAHARELVDAPQVEDLLIDSLRAIRESAIRAGVPESALPLNRAQIKADAIANFRKMPLSEATNVRAFERAIADNSKKIEQGLLRTKDPKKLLKGFRARQAMVQNLYMLSEAHRYAKLLRDAKAEYSRLASQPTSSKVDQSFWNNVLLTLEKVGFELNPRYADEIHKQVGTQTPEQFAELINSTAGYEMFYVPPTKTSLGDMNADEFDDLQKSIESLQAIGKDIHTILVDGQEREVQEFVNEIVSNIHRRGINFTEGTGAPEPGIRSFLRWGEVLLRRMEHFFRDVDRDNPDGPAARSIIQRTQEGKHAEAVLVTDITRDFQKFLEGNETDLAKGLKRPLDLPQFHIVDKFGTQRKIIRNAGDLVCAGLNLGNANNAHVFLQGYGYTRASIEQAMGEHLTLDELGLINQVWKTYENLWPSIENLARATKGVAPPKYDATPFAVLKDGKLVEMSGGYVPLRRSIAYAPNIPAQFGPNSLFGPDYASTLPSDRHTQLRTGAVYPILLDLNSTLFGIRQAIHDVAQRKQLIDAAKVALHPDVLQAIQDHYGLEAANAVRPWLEYTARESVVNDRATSGLVPYIRAVRRNLVGAALGLRLSVPLKHFTVATLNSAAEVGPRELTSAIADIFGNPTKTKAIIERIAAESVEMRYRWDNLDSDLRSQALSLLRKSGVISQLQHMQMFGVAMSDMFSAAATYEAAKRTALASGASEAWAIARGEAAVRLAHGAAAPTDVSPILREGRAEGHEIARLLLTPFQSFINVSWNQNWRTLRLLQLGAQAAQERERYLSWEGYDPIAAAHADQEAAYAYAKAHSRLIHAMLAGLGIGLVTHELTGGKQGWLEDLGLGELEQAFGGFPFLGNALRALPFLGEGGSDDVVAQALEEFVRTAQFLGYASGVSAAVGAPVRRPSYNIHDLLNIGGAFTGLGLDGTYDVGDYVYSAAAGQAPPYSPASIAYGLAHGVHKMSLVPSAPSLRRGRL